MKCRRFIGKGRGGIEFRSVLRIHRPAIRGTFLVLPKTEKKGKEMKKIIAFICILTMLLPLASCKKKIAEEGDVTVVVEDTNGNYEVYMTYLENVENKNEGALGVLENLKNREENPLHLVYQSSSYGAFITEIGSIKQDETAGAYIMVYTSAEIDSYVDAPTVNYGEALLFSSGVGVNLMTVEAGCVILFRLEVYSA